MDFCNNWHGIFLCCFAISPSIFSNFCTAAHKNVYTDFVMYGLHDNSYSNEWSGLGLASLIRGKKVKKIFMIWKFCTVVLSEQSDFYGTMFHGCQTVIFDFQVIRAIHSSDMHPGNHCFHFLKAGLVKLYLPYCTALRKVLVHFRFYARRIFEAIHHSQVNVTLAFWCIAVLLTITSKIKGI